MLLVEFDEVIGEQVPWLCRGGREEHLARSNCACHDMKESSRVIRRGHHELVADNVYGKHRSQSHRLCRRTGSRR